MRLLNSIVLATLTSVATTTLARSTVYINNHLGHDIYITRVDQNGSRTDTLVAYDNQTWAEMQDDTPGVAIKITPGKDDVDIPGKGVLTLGYTYTPEWIYYDLGVYLYYPFPGAKARLSGAGGDNYWGDGTAHGQNTIAYNGETNLTLDLWY